MGELYYPFATGAGANADEVAWGNIFLAMGRPGVLIGEGTEFAVTTPGGAAFRVGTGKAHCFGHYYELTAQTANINVANNTGATRFDRVVIEFDFANDIATVKVLSGEGAPSRLATMTFDRTGVYHVPLAVIAVPNGANIVGGVTMALDRWALPLHWFPAGQLLPATYGQATLPKTMVFAVGQLVKRLEYERLWSAYPFSPFASGFGTPPYHGRIIGANPGADQILIPDMRGRGFFGLDDMGVGGDAGRIHDLDVLGNVLGDSYQDASGLPPHTHELNNNNIGAQFFVKDGTSTVRVQGNVPDEPTLLGAFATLAGVQNKVGTFNTGDQTGGGADPNDNNMPPALLGYWTLLV